MVDPKKASSGKRVVAGVCGILLGSLGVHKFVLGYYLPGIIMLLVTILSCTLLGGIVHIVGLIEGILYLAKSDDEFYDTYVAHRKSWF